MRIGHRALPRNRWFTIGLIIVNAALVPVVPAMAATLGFVQQFDDNRSDNTDYYYFPTGVDISPDGKHVYLSSQIDNAITVFTRDISTGRLSQAGNVRQDIEGVDGLKSAKDIILSPDGKHVYAIGLGKGNTTSAIYASLVGFTRDAQTGLLTPADLRQEQGQTNSNSAGNINVAFSSDYAKLAFSPDGYFLYVSAFNSNNVMVFQRAAANGVLSLVEVFSGDVNGSAVLDNIAFARGITVSPDGKNVYVTGGELRGPGSGAVTVFSRHAITGRLTLLHAIVNGQGGVSGLARPRDVLVSPDGKHVYVAAGQDNDIVVFNRASDGQLTYVEKVNYFDTLANTNVLMDAESLVFSPNGRFLYVGTNVGSTVAVLRRNGDTGALTPVGYEGDKVNGLTLGSVVSMAIASDGRHLYVASDQRIDGITVFNTTADLSIVKQDNVDPVTPGGSITYTLTVTNNGPSNAQNVMVTDALPAGMTLIDAAVAVPGMSCANSSGSVTCSVGNLPTMAAATISLQVSAPMTAGMITNTATVTADQIDDQSANDSDSETTEVRATGGSGGGVWSPWLTVLVILVHLHRRRQGWRFTRS